MTTTHPTHELAMNADGMFLPVPPVPERTRRRQRARERRCQAIGGHWLHPLTVTSSGAWVWFCCGCSARALTDS